MILWYMDGCSRSEVIGPDRAANDGSDLTNPPRPRHRQRLQAAEDTLPVGILLFYILSCSYIICDCAR